MSKHRSDCITNGFDMPNLGIVYAAHCSCRENNWVCPRCGIDRLVFADIEYVEHRCPDDEIQSLDRKDLL